MPVIDPEQESQFSQPVEEEASSEQQVAPSIQDYINQREDFQDATPDYVTKQPTQTSPTQPSHDYATSDNPNQVTGPNSPLPTQRVSNEQLSNRLGKPLPNPSNVKAAEGKSGVQKFLSRFSKGNPALPAAPTSVFKSKNSESDKDSAAKEKVKKTANYSKKTASSIARIVESGGFNVKAWWDLLAANWKLLLFPVVLIAFFITVLALAFFGLSNGRGDKPGGIGIPSTSAFSSSLSNPNGISLDVMSPYLDVNIPGINNGVPAQLSIDASSGTFSMEDVAYWHTSSNGKKYACVIDIDTGKPKLGNKVDGLACLSNETATYKDMTTGETKTMTDDELNWYAVARWGYCKITFSAKCTLNPQQPEEDFWGRKIVIYAPATNRAVVLMAADYGPNPTGSTLGPNQQALWQYGPDGPAPRLQVPKGFVGRVAGSGKNVSDYLGVGNNMSKSTDNIIVGFLRSDLQDSVSVGPLTNFKVLTHDTVASGGTEAKVPLYHQGDYASIAYPSSTNSRRNIADSGCGIVSAAMVLKFNGVGGSGSPTSLIQDLASFSENNGYRDPGGTAWSFFPAIAKKYGLQEKDVTNQWDTILNYLRQGTPVIVSGHGTAPYSSAGHFVVLVGIDGAGDIVVNNPAHGKAALHYTLSALQQGTTHSARVLYK